MNSAQKISSSTQQFTEIADFSDTIVLFQGGSASLVIEITASNFALLSQKEQAARIYAYASLLNSLTFPIQILIRNKRIDVSSYLKELDIITRSTKNPELVTYIKKYRDFVHELVTINVVLSKSFYIVLSYSSLETGIKGAGKLVQKNAQLQVDFDSFKQTAQKSLDAKAEALLPQLQKFATSAKILEKEELIKLFYELYNEDATTIDLDQTLPGVESAFIAGDINT